jgi:DNA-binding NtrC family response regulator
MTDRVLIIDDDRDLLEAVDDALIGLGYETTAHSSGAEGLRALDSEEFDLVLTDVRMPQIDGVRLCDHITGNHPQLPVILMTAYGDVGTAVDAMRARACDFLLKPFTEDQLGTAVRRALTRPPSSNPEVHRLVDSQTPDQGSLGQLVGGSPAMAAVVERLLRAAPTDSTVLITGESGTGKELLARALHENSRRRGGPFVALSCAAVPAEVLESELFGHVKGAFTGATSEAPGLLRDASGGTLFLDEVGAMPLDLQPKLLRALQSRSVRPVGGDREEHFDARVVAATNADLHRAVESGAFCEGLYYRLNVIALHLPPLRDRGEDVVELAKAFLERHSRKTNVKYDLTDETKSRLLQYPWPGNVR